MGLACLLSKSLFADENFKNIFEYMFKNLLLDTDVKLLSHYALSIESFKYIPSDL